MATLDLTFLVLDPKTKPSKLPEQPHQRVHCVKCVIVLSSMLITKILDCLMFLENISYKCGFYCNALTSPHTKWILLMQRRNAQTKLKTGAR